MTLSIVIIEYKSLEEISVFVDNAKNSLRDVDYEIIVSSNSLYNQPQQTSIKQSFPNIRWVFNERNGGFAYGMNRGLEIAQGSYLMIANPDLVIKSGVGEGIDYLRHHAGVGAIGPVIKNNKGVIQDSARPFVTLPRWILRQLKRVLGRDDKYDYSYIQPVDWVIGACILMSRDVYNKVGGLDESYFMYAEDMDFCTRVHLAGQEVVLFPQMQVEYEGTRSARHSLKYARIFLQSHRRYWKNFGYFSII